MIDLLKKQLEHTKQEFEQAKAHVIRCDGAIQLLEHLIKEAEAEALKVTEAVKKEL